MLKKKRNYYYYYYDFYINKEGPFFTVDDDDNNNNKHYYAVSRDDMDPVEVIPFEFYLFGTLRKKNLYRCIKFTVSIKYWSLSLSPCVILMTFTFKALSVYLCVAKKKEKDEL